MLTDYPDCAPEFAVKFKRELAAVQRAYDVGLWAVVAGSTPKAKWQDCYLGTRIDGWWVYLPTNSHLECVCQAPDGAMYRLAHNGRSWHVRTQAYRMEILKLATSFDAALEVVDVVDAANHLRDVHLGNKLTGLGLCLGMAVNRHRLRAKA